MNRKIASGILKLPDSILQLAGSSGVALVFWIVGGIVALCIVTVWSEMALFIPLVEVIRDGAPQRISTPRSGGDKNYVSLMLGRLVHIGGGAKAFQLEYLYRRPRLLMTCIFSTSFIIFGNVAHNVIQFGVYMTMAIHPDCTSACVDVAGLAQYVGSTRGVTAETRHASNASVN